MKKITTLLVVICLLTVSASLVLSENEATPKSTLLSLLKVGQEVRIVHGAGDAFIVTVINDRLRKLTKGQEDERSTASKIIAVEADYITVSDPGGLERSILAGAIHVIQRYPDEKSPAEAELKK